MHYSIYFGTALFLVFLRFLKLWISQPPDAPQSSQPRPHPKGRASRSLKCLKLPTFAASTRHAIRSWEVAKLLRALLIVVHICWILPVTSFSLPRKGLVRCPKLNRCHQDLTCTIILYARVRKMNLSQVIGFYQKIILIPPLVKMWGLPKTVRPTWGPEIAGGWLQSKLWDFREVVQKARHRQLHTLVTAFCFQTHDFCSKHLFDMPCRKIQVFEDVRGNAEQ